VLSEGQINNLICCFNGDTETSKIFEKDEEIGKEMAGG
jgi:hypothetical protein